MLGSLLNFKNFLVHISGCRFKFSICGVYLETGIVSMVVVGQLLLSSFQFELRDLYSCPFELKDLSRLTFINENLNRVSKGFV